MHRILSDVLRSPGIVDRRVSLERSVVPERSRERWAIIIHLLDLDRILKSLRTNKLPLVEAFHIPQAANLSVHPYDAFAVQSLTHTIK